MKRNSLSLIRRWREKAEEFSRQASVVDRKYDGVIRRVGQMTRRVSSCGEELKVLVEELKSRVDHLKEGNGRLARSVREKQLDKTAEDGLEMELQETLSELHSRRGELERELVAISRETIELKKGYAGVIREYKDLKEEESGMRVGRKVEKKREVLEEREKVEERNERKEEREGEREEEDSYQALLQAAGHKGDVGEGIRVGREGRGKERSGGETLRKVSSSVLESNIQILISTGNYTEDDPVIKYIRDHFEG